MMVVNILQLMSVPPKWYHGYHVMIMPALMLIDDYHPC